MERNKGETASRLFFFSEQGCHVYILHLHTYNVTQSNLRSISSLAGSSCDDFKIFVSQTLISSFSIAPSGSICIGWGCFCFHVKIALRVPGKTTPQKWDLFMNNNRSVKDECTVETLIDLFNKYIVSICLVMSTCICDWQLINDCYILRRARHTYLT